MRIWLSRCRLLGFPLRKKRDEIKLAINPLVILLKALESVAWPPGGVQVRSKERPRERNKSDLIGALWVSFFRAWNWLNEEESRRGEKTLNSARGKF